MGHKFGLERESAVLAAPGLLKELGKSTLLFFVEKIIPPSVTAVFDLKYHAAPH